MLCESHCSCCTMKLIWKHTFQHTNKDLHWISVPQDSFRLPKQKNCVPTACQIKHFCTIHFFVDSLAVFFSPPDPTFTPSIVQINLYLVILCFEYAIAINLFSQLISRLHSSVRFGCLAESRRSPNCPITHSFINSSSSSHKSLPKWARHTIQLFIVGLDCTLTVLAS